MVEVNDEVHIPSIRRWGSSPLCRWCPIAGAGPASTLQEGHDLRARKKIIILHPHEEIEELSALPPKGHILHVVEHTDIAKCLLDALRWPGVERQALNADLDMEWPADQPGVGVKAPRMDEARGRTDIERACTKSSIVLLRVVKLSEKVFRLVGWHGNTPVRNAKLPMYLIGHSGHALLEGKVMSGEDDRPMA
jgi:hypothetical protein